MMTRGRPAKCKEQKKNKSYKSYGLSFTASLGPNLSNPAVRQLGLIRGLFSRVDRLEQATTPMVYPLCRERGLYSYHLGRNSVASG